MDYYEAEGKRKGGFWGKFLAAFLGFLLGIIATAGALVGVGYYIYTQMKIKDGIDTAESLGVKIGDYTQYITEEYAQKTVQQLVEEVVDISKEFGDGKGTLRSFARISPQVEKIADSLTKTFSEYGLELSSDVLLDAPLGNFPDFLKDTIFSAELGTILDSLGYLDPENGNYGIFMSLSYGKENTHYITEESGKVTMLKRQVAVLNDSAYDEYGEKLPGTVTKTDEGYTYSYTPAEGENEASVFYALNEASGETLTITSEGEDGEKTETVAPCYYALDKNNAALYYEPKTIDDLMSGGFAESFLSDTKISSLVTDSGDSPLIQAVGNWTLGDLTDQSKIESLKLSDILCIDENSSLLLQSLSDWTLNDFGDQEKIESLKLSDLLEIDENSSLLLQSLSDWTLNDFKDQENIESLKLGDILEINEESSLLLQTVSDWTLKDLSDQEKIESLQLGNILDIDENSSRLLQTLSDWTLNDFKDQEKIDSLKVNDLLDIDENSSLLLQAVADWTLNDLSDQEKIESLQLNQILDIDEESSLLLKAVSDWKLNDFNNQEKIDSLKLGDILVIDETDENTARILISIKDTQLGNLSDTINNLTLVEILGEESVEENTILKHLKNSTVKTLADDLENLTIQQVFEDKVYEAAVEGEARKLTGTWKYLLTDRETGAERPYKITEINELVSNMTHNIELATMKELDEDGVVVLEDKTILTSKITYIFEYTAETAGQQYTIHIGSVEEYKTADGTVKTEIGQLTIKELIDYVTQIVKLFPAKE